VAAGHGQALALKAVDGSLIWRASLPGPSRAAPTLSNGLVFITAADNSTVALNIADGSQAWLLRGTSEAASVLGSPAPATANEAIISALSNGDIVVMHVTNGRELWRSSLGSVRRFDFGTKLSDIVGMPAVADKILYATSAAGRFAALSLRAGSRIWERRIGGMSSPWIAGDFIYMVTDQAELVCLFRPDGRIRWVQALQRFADPEARKGALYFAGPVMAGGRLAVVRSDGVLKVFDPTSGTEEATLNIGKRTLLPPVVAGGTLYTLSEDGTLSAFR
jgi:outer membrane protein assembly factor BamB